MLSDLSVVYHFPINPKKKKTKTKNTREQQREILLLHEQFSNTLLITREQVNWPSHELNYG